MATYCIGDVQGCFVELKNLLATINFDPQSDTLWFTGDLVNRGPDSLQVLRFIKALGDRAITVLGNHDLHFLALAANPKSEIHSQYDTLDELLAAPDCADLCAWLRQQPLLHHDASVGFTMVHAGLPPQWDLVKAQRCAQEVEQVLRSDRYIEFFTHLYGNQPNCWNEDLTGWDRLRVITNYFTRLRFCTMEGVLELNTKGESHKPPAGYLPWFKISHRLNQDLKIVFGHWAALEGKTDTPNVYALDTGCAWGRCLSAMRLEDLKWFSVKCRKN